MMRAKEFYKVERKVSLASLWFLLLQAGDERLPVEDI